MPIQSATTDLTLQQQAAAELAADLQQGAAHIGVIAEDGVVTLTGYVATYTECQIAERAVFRVKNVLGVINHLEIDLPALHSHGDARIARTAAHTLETNLLIPEHAVQIKVEQGVVTLSGQVDKAAQRQAAQAAVGLLSGVVQVINHLTTSAATDPASAALPDAGRQ